MSSTATTTRSQTSTLSVLADYELHHSGREQASPVSAPRESSAPATPAPANWTTDHRRVPAYRPVNRNLDRNARPAGSNAGEFVFIQSMLHGVWLNASVAQLWRATGGRLNDRIFYYDIGGEW